MTALPVGAYDVTITAQGLASSHQRIVVTSGSAPVVHFQLAIGTRSEQVTVAESALAVSPEQMTPTTIVSRNEIAMTPGADLSNSLHGDYGLRSRSMGDPRPVARARRTPSDLGD